MATVDTTAGSSVRVKTRWGRDLATFSGWLVGSYLLSMLVWVAIPWLLWGWTPMVVATGSMSPAIRAGDVILVEPVGHLLGAGTVIAFDQGDGVVVHRVSGVDRSGEYTTKGDANPTVDSTPVHSSEVIGRGRLLVPYLGLVRVMGAEWWLVAGAFAGVVVALWWRGPGILATATGLSLIATTALALAAAVFVATTANASNSLTTVDPQPPTNLTASCGAVGAVNVDVDLTWTASSTTVLTGYEILHDDPSAGTNYGVVGSTGPATTSFTHTIPVAVLGLGTHTYVVRTVVSPWVSPFSNSDAVDITEVLLTYVCTEV